MSRFEQPRRGSKRSVELPPSPVPTPEMNYSVANTQYNLEEGVLSNIGCNMTYITIGAVGISIALSIFLYREMRKMKSEVLDLAKAVHDNDQQELNTKSIENIEEQISQIKNMLQQMTQRSGGPSPAQLAAMEQARQAAMAAQKLPIISENTEISENGPDDSNENDSEEEECDNDVCLVPKKKDKKVLHI